MTEDPTVSAATTRGRIPADIFSNRLLLARRLAGMSIEEAAAACGLNKSSWANWENGRRPHGQVEICQAIAATLDIDFNWLLMGGPLTPAQGRPTKRPASLTDRYPTSDLGCEPAYGAYSTTSVRPSDLRPKGRTDRSRPASPAVSGRRAAMVR